MYGGGVDNGVPQHEVVCGKDDVSERITVICGYSDTFFDDFKLLYHLNKWELSLQILEGGS